MQQYDLIALRTFVSVVEAGSFNRAAEHLEASAAAVSRRVSGLENALGVKLLNRTTRQVDLTEAGRQFYADVVNIIASLEEAEEKIQSGRETIKGNLRIAAPLSFGIGRIAPILPIFMKRYPELKVHLQLEDRFTDLVAEGIDVAIRIGALKDSTLVATRLGSIPRVFCASPEYLASHGDVLKEAAIQGLGIVLMPTFIVEDALADGRLKAILRDYCPIPFGLYAVRPSRHFTPERVRILIEFLREHIGDEIPEQNITHI